MDDKDEVERRELVSSSPVQRELSLLIFSPLVPLNTPHEMEDRSRNRLLDKVQVISLLTSVQKGVGVISSNRTFPAEVSSEAL